MANCLWRYCQTQGSFWGTLRNTYLPFSQLKNLTMVQEDVLLISDPKALQYIYQTAGYRFPKHGPRRAFTHALTGSGLVWVEGESNAGCFFVYSMTRGIRPYEGNDHKRHRKVMLPGFGTPETKALLPIFSLHAAKVYIFRLRLISPSSPFQSSPSACCCLAGYPNFVFRGFGCCGYPILGFSCHIGRHWRR